MKKTRVFVTGCYDLLHSGHIEFFKQASEYGNLYVGIGSDKTIEEYKHHKPMFPEQERLFMVKAIRYVTDAYINQGLGIIDFLPTIDLVKPDIFVVNAEGGSDEKRKICEERDIQYVVLKREPHEGFEARSSSAIKRQLGAIPSSQPNEESCNSGCEISKDSIPTRLDLAGTWIDQPYVSCYYPGWALTISLEPTFEIRERCGLSTSTRNQIRKIWPVKLPQMNPEMLARLVFCFENQPEREDGIISGAQDSIGICVPGLCRHYYNGHFWPEKIEMCQDEMTLRFLESHLCLIPLEPRKPGCSVIENKDISKEKVYHLAKAAEDCWAAILNRDLNAFADAYNASFQAQISMFPGMVNPTIICNENSISSNGKNSPDAFSLQPAIDRWKQTEDVLALKFPGAGGGGYFALVVKDSPAFCKKNEEAIPLKIRRN